MLSDQLKQIRSQNRISSRTVLNYLFHDFVAIHGDRVLGDDAALTGGVALFNDQPVTVLAVNRGHNAVQRQHFNGGMVSVSGYCKALRLIKAAQRFNRPVISLIDMPGADASAYSEHHGQSQAIAEMLAEMGELSSPNMAIFLGEGHSGGALAFANTNRIIMLENALFSVASPEAVAAIVNTDTDINEYLPMTATALKRIGLVDDVVREGPKVLENIERAVAKQLSALNQLNEQELINQRQKKYLKVLEAGRE
ncbi:carboxyltransferase subunit alpha [Paucilactobacillus wasatchensis]|uniref:acetyl-CoA carboxytransferase n=1 Tax=Paucilactobacillus wasatchensis TaxID=1335616 RepID=A0A0D1A7U2_9LACO|nr:carboxyltransferase subunit alpha [Paucilactobacillus wasatchensis]KIS03782.1 acetyl-CoA carboxylase, carboxyl transferase subunit alpha [Paucilactobacillus wasatchensis]